VTAITSARETTRLSSHGPAISARGTTLAAARAGEAWIRPVPP
jgi:hypothetical protein